MGMRIIAGRARGIKLYAPRGRRIRPTADRVKESIFSILGEPWAGIRVLDLFSGTGSLGLEAISRGAKEAVFVEHSKTALDLLRRNIALCGFEHEAVVLPVSVSRGLAILGQREESFPVIFVDPPYGRGWVEKTIRQILAHGVLAEDGTVVLEHTLDESPSRVEGPLTTLRQERYGETAVSFLVSQE